MEAFEGAGAHPPAIERHDPREARHQVVEVVEDATKELVTKDYLRAELYRALWFFGIGIVTVNSIIFGSIIAIVEILR